MVGAAMAQSLLSLQVRMQVRMQPKCNVDPYKLLTYYNIIQLNKPRVLKVASFRSSLRKNKQAAKCSC